MIDIQAMAAFLVEDERIFSFLDSLDVLRLYTIVVRNNFNRANVNRYLNDVTHQDSIWRRLFSMDSEENIAIAIQNEWLLQKHRLFHSPAVPEEEEEEEEEM